jgi:hypothetical protein
LKIERTTWQVLSTTLVLSTLLSFITHSLFNNGFFFFSLNPLSLHFSSFSFFKEQC